MNKLEYQKFLKSPEWCKFKKDATILFEGKCWFCGSTENLQLHHMRYNKKTLLITTRKPKNNMRWFLLLCDVCHAGVHTLQRQTGHELYKATQKFREKHYPSRPKFATKKHLRKIVGNNYFGTAPTCGMEVGQPTDRPTVIIS